MYDDAFIVIIISRTLKLITLKDQNGPDWVQSDIALLT